MNVRKPDKSESVVFCWLGGAMLLLLGMSWLFETDGVPAGPILIGWLVVGLLLLIVLLFRRHWRASAMLAILTFVLAFLGPLITRLGASLI